MCTGMNYPLFCIQSLCTCILSWFIMDTKQLPKILLRHLDQDKKAFTKKISKNCPTSQKESIWEAVNSWKISARHSLLFGWAETVRDSTFWIVKLIQRNKEWFFTAYTQLRQQKKFLSERKHTVLWNIIQEHLYLDVYEGIARNRGQINATAGGMIGEANRQANRAKIFYGL